MKRSNPDKVNLALDDLGRVVKLNKRTRAKTARVHGSKRKSVIHSHKPLLLPQPILAIPQSKPKLKQHKFSMENHGINSLFKMTEVKRQKVLFKVSLALF